MFSRSLVLPVLAATFLSPTFALAQSNEIYITQDGASNELYVDQSEARNSLVRGVPLSDDDPNFGLRRDANSGAAPAAGQFGVGNSADVVIGYTGPLAGASPSIAELTQSGIGNDGELMVQGVGARASLAQIGNYNIGSVSVEGDDASGTLIQNGNRNSMALEVTNSQVEYVQEGNGLQPQAAVQVYRNTGGRVFIRQSVPGSN